MPLNFPALYCAPATAEAARNDWGLIFANNLEATANIPNANGWVRFSFVAAANTNTYIAHSAFFLLLPLEIITRCNLRCKNLIFSA